MRRAKIAGELPTQFKPLMIYNEERARGLVHTPEYDDRMRSLQVVFVRWASVTFGKGEHQ